MADTSPSSSQGIVRVFVPGQPAFQLRKGEEGISVFDRTLIDPLLTVEEVLDYFRPGSQAITRAIADIEAKGLRVVTVEGAETLPEHLRRAHREIRPAPGMTRQQFKTTLRELE
jgi:hypothetical protein